MFAAAGKFATGMKQKAISSYTSAANTIGSYNQMGKQLGYGNTARALGGNMGKSAMGFMGKHKIAASGAAMGAGYGALSDDTSVLGGAAMGAGAGVAGAVGYGLAKPRFAGLMNKFSK